MAPDPLCHLNSIPRSLLSSDPGAVSPPKVKTGSSTVTVVELTVVVVPLTVKSPPTVVLPFAASTVKLDPLTDKLPSISAVCATVNVALADKAPSTSAVCPTFKVASASTAALHVTTPSKSEV